MDSFFGSLLGKVAAKAVNAANSDRKLKCYGCDKITCHVTISYSDVFKSVRSHKDNILDDGLGILLDFTPAVFPIMVGNSYACNDCKRIRFEGGIASNNLNRDSMYL